MIAVFFAGVVTVLFGVVVPKFGEIISTLGGSDVSLQTESVLLLGRYAWIIAGLLLVAIITFRKNRSVQVWCRRKAPWSYLFGGVVPAVLAVLILTYTVVGLFKPISKVSELVGQLPADAEQGTQDPEL